jgi:hypothetical protein
MFSFVCTCGGTPYQCTGSGRFVINWPPGPRSKTLIYGSADLDLCEIPESIPGIWHIFLCPQKPETGSQIQGGKNWILPKERYAKPILLRLLLTGNLVKPLMSLYGTEWRGGSVAMDSDVKQCLLTCYIR